MQTILSQNDWNQIILYENKRLQTVFTKDSLSLSCMKLKILLPVISRGMSPHWVKSTPPNTDSSRWKKTSCSKIRAPPPLHLHPPPGSTCRFSTSPQVLFEKKSEGTSILGWLRIATPPPILHSFNSDTTHFVSPIHKDWPFEAGNLDSLHCLAI